MAERRDDGDLGTPGDNLTTIETFVVLVNPVNDRPTLDAIANQSLEEDQALTIDLSGIFAGGGEIQPLMVTATSSNQTLMSDPVVDYTSDDSTGQLHLVPEQNQTGSTVISVTVEDGGLDGDLLTKEDNATYTRVFAVDVDAVNDTPTLHPIDDLQILEDAGEQVVELGGITAGSGENQVMRVTASSSDSDLISNWTVDYTSPSSRGELIFFSNADRFGTVVLTVTVEDGGLDNDLSTSGDNATFSQSFAVTIDPVNDDPRFNVPSEVFVDRSSGLSRINITGVDSGPFESQPLRFEVSTDNPGLITNLQVDYTDPNSNGQITFDSLGQLGRGNIFLTLEDGGLDGNLATPADNGISTQTIDLMVTVKTMRLADVDSTVYGYVEGTFKDTYWRAGSRQQISETSYSRGSRTRLDHRWQFELPPTVSFEFLVHAGHDATNEQFRFQYQVEGSSTWKNLVKTNQSSVRKYYARRADADLSDGGTIWVRAIDTNRGADSQRATLDVERMRILARGLDEFKPAVNAFVYDSSVREMGQDRGQIRFQLADNQRLDEDLVVHYEVGGTADSGDYRQVLRGTKTIRAGNLATKIYITPNDDRLSEGNESLTIRVLPQADYRIEGSATASLKIIDNDQVTHEAMGEVSRMGGHQVNYTETFYADQQAEVVSEKLYGNRTLLDHRWRFNVAGATSVNFEGKFRIEENPFVDSFQVTYSTDQQQWRNLGRLQYGGTGDINRSLQFAPGTTDVWVRIHDRYRRPHDTHIASVLVEQLRFVRENVGGVAMMAYSSNPTVSGAGAVQAEVSGRSFQPAASLLTGSDQTLSSVSKDEFVLPEFYTQQDKDEVDAVFADLGS